MFKHFTVQASVLRMTTVGTKSSFLPVVGSVLGRLHPLADEQQNIGLENMANMFSFSTESDSDIREGDRLMIDWEKYSVRGANTHKWLRVSYRRCILIKEKAWR